MIGSVGLLTKRRFLPLFVTQFLGAFNDNLFKNAMIFFATYQIYSSEAAETKFSAIAQGLFILPFFLLSAVAGQLADSHDKARIMRIIKFAEILIMVVGAAGIFIGSLELMLAALLAMGVHSTFFGPIKYAIIPQHVAKDDVLSGTGLVEAGTYIAILCGTIAGGLLSSNAAAVTVLVVAGLGFLSSQFIPPAPPSGKVDIDWNIFRASYNLIYGTLHIRRLFLAIMSISVFWCLAAVLGVLFPPLVKNVFHAHKDVASVFLAIFSVGIAVGSLIINRLLKGQVSARYSPISVILMMGFVVDFYFAARFWPDPGDLMSTMQFIATPGAWRVFFDLAMVAITGGMFVVPLYAFLTTTVDQSQTSRTVAANNIVNSGFMAVGSVGILGVVWLGVSVVDALLAVLVLGALSAFASWRLHKACDGHAVATGKGGAGPH